MEITRIGVLSDTHIPSRSSCIPPEVIKGFEGVKFIIHAGDINNRSVLKVLENIAPVYAVAGNTDSEETKNLLGFTKIINIVGHNIGIFHGFGQNSALNNVKKVFDKKELSAVIFGHSHSPYNDIIDGVLYFNPGSPTDKRRQPHYSYGILNIGNGIIGDIIYF